MDTRSLHDYADRFSARVQSFDAFRSRTYCRGFKHGLMFAVAVVAVSCLYFYVGGAA